MDDAAQTPLGSDELTSGILKGATIYGAHGAVMGHVSHLHGSGAACQVIVELGGLPGHGTRPVVVGLGQLSFTRNVQGQVQAMTVWTRDQLLAMPMHVD